jgi:hypothetical protein
MIRVLQTDGTIHNVAEAVSAEIRGPEVVCYDRRGVIVARFPSDSVTIFGRNLPSDAEMADGDAPMPVL